MATGRSSSQHQASDFSSSQHQASDFGSSQHQASDFSSSQHQESDFSSSQHQASDFSSSQHQASDFSSSVHKGSVTLDTSEQCQNHKDNKLELFCQVHDVLICSRCLIHSHKKCTERVVLIDEKVKTMQQTGDFTKLTKKIHALKQELTMRKKIFEGNADRLQKAFQEQLHKINTLRKTFNETLEMMESNTIKELNTLLETLKSPVQDDIHTCIDALSRMQNIQEEIQNMDKNTETLKLILYRKYSENSSEIELIMKSQMVSNRITTIQFLSDPSIERIFSLSSFGKLINPNEILKVSGNTKYNIRRWRNYSICRVAQICETDSGQLLITDVGNMDVKLLDENFKVVTYHKFASKPRSICSIDSSLVAVALDNSEVHTIRVTNVGQLRLDRKLKLEHECTSIAYHQGFLYITSGAALYRYQVCGTLVSKIYEDLSRRKKVEACAISPDGTKLYMYVEFGKELVTLSRDGRVINKVTIFCDEDFHLLYEPLHNLHVTDYGQVLLCSTSSNKIVQVDRDGRQILAEVVTEKDGVCKPLCVYYSKHRAALIVGMYGWDSILVFKT